jgi:hypothetical protein
VLVVVGVDERDEDERQAEGEPDATPARDRAARGLATTALRLCRGGDEEGRPDATIEAR